MITCERDTSVKTQSCFQDPYDVKFDIFQVLKLETFESERVKTKI